MADLLANYQIPAELAAAVSKAVQEMEKENIVARIWQRDHTVWKESPDEITKPDRLGWLDVPQRMQSEVVELRAFLDEVLMAGYAEVVLLGMGGSSLAAEVFYNILGGDGLKLTVLDSTNPDAVLDLADELDYGSTLFIVSSKSGTTVETLSFFNYFYNQVVAAVGQEAAGAHFTAITDADSKLDQLAQELDFRAIFINDPAIGGRYSALSYFGLVPAVLIGADAATLLERAGQMAAASGPGIRLPANPAAYLGVVLGVLARHGRDKLTFIAPEEIESFGYWVEQLIAESTGKKGTGIVPVEGEPVGLPGDYANDRVFIYLAIGEDDNYETAVGHLADADYPVIRLELEDLYDITAEMWRWEMATAVAGHLLGINPFDQPNVEAAKTQARQLTETYAQTGQLPEEKPAFRDTGITVYADEKIKANSARSAIRRFLKLAQPGDYVAIQAYLPPADETIERELLGLRTAIRDRTKLATTTGYGPRFLHSTGQLHKGDRGNGLFIVLTANSQRDADIPHEAGSSASDLSFGVLHRAQALGDMEALRQAGRRVIRFHLEDDPIAGLRRLREGAKEGGLLS